MCNALPGDEALRDSLPRPDGRCAVFGGAGATVSGTASGDQSHGLSNTDGPLCFSCRLGRSTAPAVHDRGKSPSGRRVLPACEGGYPVTTGLGAELSGAAGCYQITCLRRQRADAVAMAAHAGVCSLFCKFLVPRILDASFHTFKAKMKA